MVSTVGISPHSMLQEQPRNIRISRWVDKFALTQAAYLLSGRKQNLAPDVGIEPSKPKYSSATDSEPVPWGKGEKHPDEGSETVPETGYLQTVGAQDPFWVTAYLLYYGSAT